MRRLLHPLTRGLRETLQAIDRWLRPQPTVTVIIYLNADPEAMLTGYSPGAPMVLSHRYTLPAATAGTDSLLLERIFAALNSHPVHPDDQQHATAWTAEHRRSLSVGDVVAIDDRLYACAARGWTSIPAPNY